MVGSSGRLRASFLVLFTVYTTSPSRLWELWESWAGGGRAPRISKGCGKVRRAGGWRPGAFHAPSASIAGGWGLLGGGGRPGGRGDRRRPARAPHGGLLSSGVPSAILRLDSPKSLIW